MPRCTDCGARADGNRQTCHRCGAVLPGGEGGDTPDTEGVDGEGRKAADRPASHRAESGRSTGAIPDPSTDRTGGTTDTERTVPGYFGSRTPGDVDGGTGSGDVPLPDRESGFAFVLGHPLRNGRRPLLVSAALLLGGVLVIPALVLAGYSYRLGRSAVFAAEEPPAYDNWGGLLMDGARLVIVVSIPALLWSAGTVVLLGLMLLVVPSDSGVLSVTALGSLAGLLWFVGTYVVAFVGSDSAVEALRGDRRSVLRSDGGYIRHWVAVLGGATVLLVGLGAALAALLVARPGGPLGVAVSGGWLVGVAVVLAYALLAGATHAGYVYYTLAERGLVPPPEENVGMSPGNTSLGTDG